MKSKILFLQAILLLLLIQSCTKEESQLLSTKSLIENRTHNSIKVQIKKTDNSWFISDVHKAKVHYNDQTSFNTTIFTTSSDSLIILGKEISFFHPADKLKLTTYSSNVAYINELLTSIECNQISLEELILNIGGEVPIYTTFFIVEETDGF